MNRVAAWALAGGVLGLALETGARLTGEDWTLSLPLAVMGALCGGLVEWVWWERRRPFGLAVAPHAIGVPSLLALGVFGAVATDSLLPAVMFSSLAFGVALAAWRLRARRQLDAVMALPSRGPSDLAALARLATARGTPRTVAEEARFHLATEDLLAGRLERAQEAFGALRRGRLGLHAAASEALCRALLGDLLGAERALARVYGGADGHARSRADGVRLLVVARREGPQAARALGEQLATGAPGPLTVGLLAWARAACGDAGAAGALLTPAWRQALSRDGTADHVEEVREVLAAMEAPNAATPPAG